ncbi:S24 family peptidase [Roseibaca sp. V10]|uniref:S24 family peptidase n=1 Tax=Roseinatronobacter domitianus TaxID=2940293 RepID=A0ABT0M3R8_9RHOB|nr:S24 family peptidase [Roseibaca domitiana]MCL1629293.1 S24 family peptidase [Roseibaca domitiana]
MDPAIYHGDLVMIDQRKTHIRSGKIYAFIDGDALRIKRIEVIPETALILRSDNPKHAPDHRVGEGMNHVSQNILGRVVWSGHNWGSETERTIMRNLFLGLPVLFVCSMANAQNFESMQRATELGTVIAAEDLCGLTFDQSAVSD